MQTPQYRLFKGVLFALGALYPIFVYGALIYWHIDVRYLISLLIVLVLIKVLFEFFEISKAKMAAYVFLLSILVLSLIFDSDLGLRFYPVVINIVMFYVFMMSLFSPPTVVERFARLQEPDLSEQGVRYTRKLTVAWCVFFVLNGVIASYTALFGSYALWSWYNGCIAYVAMALMFILEYPIRLYIKAKEQ